MSTGPSSSLSLAACRAFMAAALAALLAASALAETASKPDRGLTPGAAYDLAGLDRVNLLNGNLSLSIPLASLPPVSGGKLSWTVSTTYNSKLWDVLKREEEYPQDTVYRPYVVDLPQLAERGGWQVGGAYHVEVREARSDYDYFLPASPGAVEQHEWELLAYHNYYKVFLVMPDGSERELRPLDRQPYQGTHAQHLKGAFAHNPRTAPTPTRYYTFDGSFISAVVYPYGSARFFELFLPDGTRVVEQNGLQRITDTNGNSIKIYSDTAGTHYQDERTGREITTAWVSAETLRVSTRTVGGGWAHTDVLFGTTTVHGKVYPVKDWAPYGGENGEGYECTRQAVLQNQQLTVVRQIVFPPTEPTQEPLRYGFEYNSDATEPFSTERVPACGPNGYTSPYATNASRGTGELSRVTTPSGARISYAYSNDSTHLFTTEADELVESKVTKRTVEHDGVSEEWNYNTAFNNAGGGVTHPDGSSSWEVAHAYNPRAGGSYGGFWGGLAGRIYRSEESGRVRVERHYRQLGFHGGNGEAPGGVIAFNPVVDAEYTTLLENGTPVKMSARAFEHDRNGNVTQVREYDWFDPSLVTRDPDGVPTSVPAQAVLLRETNTSYHNSPADGYSGHVYARANAAGAAPVVLDAARESSTAASVTRFSYDGQAYGAAPTAGNVTRVSRWDDLGARWLSSTSAYGQYGNLSTTTDPRGNVTQYFYEDGTHALPTRVVVDPLNGTGQQTATTAYDFWTGLVLQTTDVNGQTSEVSYTNQLLGTADPFNRPGVTTAPAVGAGGAQHRRKVFTFYEDSQRRTRIEADLFAEGDRLLKSLETRDELGRVVLSERNEGGQDFTVSSRTAYQQAGRVVMQSSPRRGGGDATPASWTRVTKDASGRVIEAATFAGADEPPVSGTQPAQGTNSVWSGSVQTSYYGETVTVTDQAGKKRRSVTDALGRLVQVVEAPEVSVCQADGAGCATNYTYDALGNLRKVEQGAQSRYFMYDSLGQLVRAKNPEQSGFSHTTEFPALTDPLTQNSQWSLGYLYDAGGNLHQRRDARGVVTTYGYDGLNRNTSITYSGEPAGQTTPPVTRHYDAPGQNMRGRLRASETAGGTRVEYSYDALGRATTLEQRAWAGAAWGAPFAVQAAYDLSGNVTTLTYPSGRVVSYAYDQAGRLSGFTGNLGDGVTRAYADSLLYDAAGRRRQERFGTQTPVYNKHFYNSRGQLADVRVSTHSITSPGQETDWNRGAVINHYGQAVWGDNDPTNNGNVRFQQVWLPKTDNVNDGFFLFTQSYSYDALNRLKTAQEGNDWKQSYDYDRWGNRQINASETFGGVPEPQFTVDSATNRLGVPAGQAGQLSYDAAGQQTFDSYQGGQGGGGARTFDAEGRMTSAQFMSGQTQTAQYTYDADGRRVRRLLGAGGEVWQVYGLGGELLAEYTSGAAPSQPLKEYGYRAGELLVLAEAGSGSNSQRVNVAASSQGATATAQAHTTDAVYPGLHFQPTYANDSVRHISADGGSYWRDAEGLPSWVQIDFSGQKSVDEVVVYTIADYPAYAVQSDPTPTQTFTQYGATSFEVEYWTGSGWAAVPGGSVSGNNLVRRGVTFPPVTTSKIRVRVTGSVDGVARLAEVEAYEAASGGQQGPQPVAWQNAVGVSASGNGLTKTAGTGFNAGASSVQSISSGYGYVEFTATLATGDVLCGLSTGDSSQSETDIDFAVYASAYHGAVIVLEGGVNRGSFGTWTAGDRFRVAVEGGAVKYYRVGAGGALSLIYTSTISPQYPLLVDTSLHWVGDQITNVVLSGGGGSGSSGAGEVQWLVADQLGTPRMVIDRTGGLAGVKRHDYFPFGEEIQIGVGGRTTSQGYSQLDGVRQKFTSTERDDETGLDFMQARYYASAQGRFTSVDPLMASASAAAPQTWNRYTYVLNRPVSLYDPSGMIAQDPQRGANVTAAPAPEDGISVSIYYGGIIDTANPSTIGTVINNTVDVVTDFLIGIPRGMGGALSAGHVGGPLPTDSLPNRLGQAVGNGLVGASGSIMMNGGTGATIASGGAAVKVAAPVAAAGAVLVGSAVLNGLKIITVPIQMSNTNPFTGPVDQDIFIGDQHGNNIPVKTGEQTTGSPDGKWVQVRDSNGVPTGTRLDGPHRPTTHPDPRAQLPHGHVPGVNNPDGTPWLKVKP